MIVALGPQDAPRCTRALRRAFGRPVRLDRVTRQSFNNAVTARFTAELVERAITGHARRNPSLTSYRLSARLVGPATVLAGTLCLALVLKPATVLAALIALVTLFHLADFLFKGILALAGMWPGQRTQPPAVATGAALPVYSILVPLHDEAAMVGSLLTSLAAIDYPPERLDVKLILEADDAATRFAVERALVSCRLPVEVIHVPPGGPRTKPKALNIALPFVRGRYVVVFDAEDRPEPDQLRKAVARFAEGGPKLACLQARLNYGNARSNWLTRQFAVEYALWFDHLLPGLARLGLPVPLGGTSNHLRTEILREAGGWDAFNVTEDAELGLRLAAHGLRVACLDSTTWEEATDRWRTWAPQRTRWIKGYLQTFLVHLLSPGRGIAGMGLASYLAALLFLGGRLVAALVNPVLWLLLCLGLLFWQDRPPVSLPEGVLTLSLVSMIGGNLFFIGLTVAAPLRRGWRDLMSCAASVPAYWAMASLAGYRAIWQFVVAPYHWDKTPHGLSPMERRP